MNGTYAQLDDLPFYTEYQDNPALAALVKQMGGTANLNNNAVLSYVMCLLFQDAVQKATANGGTLDRQALFTALNNEHAFDAKPGTFDCNSGNTKTIKLNVTL